jgi:hypothetical protein
MKSALTYNTIRTVLLGKGVPLREAENRARAKLDEATALVRASKVESVQALSDLRGWAQANA